MGPGEAVWWKTSIKFRFFDNMYVKLVARYVVATSAVFIWGPSGEWWAGNGNTAVDQLDREEEQQCTEKKFLNLWSSTIVANDLGLTIVNTTTLDLLEGRCRFDTRYTKTQIFQTKVGYLTVILGPMWPQGCHWPRPYPNLDHDRADFFKGDHNRNSLRFVTHF